MKREKFIKPYLLHNKMTDTKLSEQEAALYDRQIRLWGLDAQKRLRGSNILLVGLGGIGAEIAKNVVLSGIKSITLVDHLNVSREDMCCQFFVQNNDIGFNRAEKSLEGIQLLNPMVKVIASSVDISSCEESFFDDFDVVCLTNCSSKDAQRINVICHSKDKLFFLGDVFGFYSYMFADLNEHEYAEDVQAKPAKSDDKESGEPLSKKTKMDTVTVKNVCSFKRFADTLSVSWEYRSVKKTPITHFIIRVLQKFVDIHGRKPSCVTADDDKVLLDKLRPDVLASMGVSESLIADDFYDHCFGELSPVCAVTGGILGQEIIKAVSRRNRPHNNFFFYNGLIGEGKVDCI